uniref:C2H2-type domain-containing protein n=1 Tax=Esox lucius TaxID=8010 RepID=A0AAY5KQL7_ESOLU
MNVLGHRTRQRKASQHSEGRHGKTSDIVKKVRRKRKHFKMESVDEEATTSATDKRFSCKYCGRGFDREFGLSVHMRSHTKLGMKGPYKCPKCPKKFPYPSRLRVHTRNSHSKMDNKKKPQTIIKEKSKPLSPIRDKPTLSNTKPLSPSRSKPLPFKDKPTSPNHTLKEGSTHPEMYSCHVCRKEYSSAQSLRDHERLHTGEKPLSCEECGKKFRCHPILISHRRSAHPGKKYQCLKCVKQFETMAERNKHQLNIHHFKKENPRSRCPRCGRSFHNSNLLRIHYETVHA